MSTVAAFIDARIAAVEKISLRDFLTQYHEAFEQELDISFMDYFLELSKRENKNQFVVHHEKLVEYGISVMTTSGDISKRLKTLGMTKEEDYELGFESQLRKQGGTSTKKIYFLTPKAFKLCLIRAQKRQNQTIDVSRYANYYLFLEEVVECYRDYQDRKNELLAINKDDRISSLENTILEAQETHKQELVDALKKFSEEANKQRAEILGETKAAHNETKAARQDISDLHDTVVSQHEAAMEFAQHASVDVPSPKRQYFAMTSYQRVGDTSGMLYFRTWRSQAVRLTPLLVKALTNPFTDKDGFEYTPHRLVVPPIYAPGAVNIGQAGKTKLDVWIKNKLTELNRGRKRDNRIKISDFKDSIGLTSSSLFPTWSPNEHLTHCEFVDCFLDSIKNAKVIKLAFAEPGLQKRIDDQVKKQAYDLTNSTGESRERIDAMIEKVRTEMETPPSSDDEHICTDHEDSE